MKTKSLPQPSYPRKRESRLVRFAWIPARAPLGRDDGLIGFGDGSPARGGSRRTIPNLKWLRRSVIALVLLVVGAVAHAQQPGQTPRIGILELGSPSASASQIKAFQQGLRERGYIEGKNII